MSDPNYQLLPPLSVEDYERLATDIRERGVLVPIDVDEDGTVLDGHHRLKIADSLGMDCPRNVVAGLSDESKVRHAAMMNVARRHLTSSQKAALAVEVEERLANLRRVGRPPKGNGGNIATVSGKARDEAAALAGTSPRYVSDAKKLKAESPEQFQRVVAGTITIPEAKREVRKEAKNRKVAEIASTPAVPLDSTGPFDVLYVDPPWRYDYAETPDLRSIENHYPTMTLEEIQALEVPSAEDSVLFLWATSPKLPEALAVMEAWGFTYRTCMVWVKDRIGMGYYARQKHELLLIGKKGALPVPDPSDRPASVVEAARGEHSAKPHVFYELIEAMYPTATYCELFARNERVRWGSWGNQAVSA